MIRYKFYRRKRIEFYQILDDPVSHTSVIMIEFIRSYESERKIGQKLRTRYTRKMINRGRHWNRKIKR